MGTVISRGLLSAGAIVGCHGFVTVVAATVMTLRNRVLEGRRDRTNRNRLPD